MSSTSPPSAGDPFPENCELIEVHVAELKQLFNAIDPSPFRERDLDPNAEEFITDWAKEASPSATFGQTDVPFFVLKAGEIEVIRPSGLGDLLVAVLRPAQFTGDVSMILGRPAQMRLRVSGSGEVVQLTRDQMHALIQTDAEMSEVLMRALIHRRVAVVALSAALCNASLREGEVRRRPLLLATPSDRFANRLS